MDNYRIHRIDKRNIAIQEFRYGEWRTVSYHGNSVKSLTDGLLALIMAQYTPADEKLLEQLRRVELALDSGIKDVEKMVKKWVNTLN